MYSADLNSSRNMSVVGSGSSLCSPGWPGVESFCFKLLSAKIYMPRIFFLILLSYTPSQPQFPLPSFPLPPLPSPLSHPSPPNTCQKKAGLPGMSTRHGLTSYSKIRHIAPHQGWTRQSSRRKRVLHAGKRVRNSPCSCS